MFFNHASHTPLYTYDHIVHAQVKANQKKKKLKKLKIKKKGEEDISRLILISI